MPRVKTVIIADDPESVLEEYDGDIILVYPRTKRPSSNVLLKKNVKVIFSSYARFPDLESFQIIRNVVIYLINTSEIRRGDIVRLIFRKRGEDHKLLFNTDELEYMTIRDLLKDRMDGRLIDSAMRFAMQIARIGIEGKPVGALLVIGDVKSVMKYVVEKEINPISAVPETRRYITQEENMDMLRQYATMDGATIIDDRGKVIYCGYYIKILASPSTPSEMGGRHLAAKSISKLTRAIAFVVSSEGKIRIYRDGIMVYQMDSF